MATRGKGFTSTVSEPDTRFAQPTNVSVNTEVNTAAGDLIGNIGTLFAQGATLANEIGQDHIRSEAVTSIEAEITSSVQDPEYFNKARKELKLAASIPNSSVRELKLQSIRNSLYRDNPGKTDRATIDKAFKDVTGQVSPTAAMAANADRLEAEARATKQAAWTRKVTQARAAGFVGGSDTEAVAAYDMVGANGAVMTAASAKGKAAGSGSLSGSTFRTTLVADLNKSREATTKFGTGLLLPMLEEFDTASMERKAELRVLMGNYINNAKARLIQQYDHDGQGPGLTQAELDYAMEPALRLINQLGSVMGLDASELTEEKALEKLQENSGFARKAIENQLMVDALNDGAMQEVFLAKQLGGDTFAGTLLDKIPKFKERIDKHIATVGMDGKAVLNGSLSHLVSGNKKFTQNEFQRQMNQSVALSVIKGAAPAAIEDQKIISNTVDMIISGDAHLKTSANQTEVLDVMGGGNGIEYIKQLQKADPATAAKAVDFYNQTSHEAVSQRMQELAQIAKDTGVQVTTKDGIFSVSGDSSEAKEAALQANAALDRMMKFQQFTPDKNKGAVNVRTNIINMQWPSIQKSVPESSPLIEIGLSPEEYKKSKAWIKIGKPVFMMTEEERKQFQKQDKAEEKRSIRIIGRSKEEK